MFEPERESLPPKDPVDATPDGAPAHEKSARPEIHESKLTIAYRCNGSYEQLAGLIASQLAKCGADVRVISVQEGRDEAAVKDQLGDCREAFSGRMVLADNTVRRALNGSAPSNSMTYSFDTLVSEELRAVLAEKRASISERKEIIAGLPTDRSDAVYRLNTYAEMFEELLKDALRVEVPDKVLILPQYLTDHEPFCLNTAFLVEAASKSGKLTACEIETLHGYLDRTLLNFLAPDLDKRGIPKEVHEILSKGLDFAPLQPHQLIALSLADVGIPIEKIAFVDKSRKELSAQDFEGQGPIWLIADRHALSLGGERGLNLRQIASTTPGVKLLRLPLENLVEDLALHNLVPPSDGQSPLQMVAERCAARLARDLCGD